MTIDGNQTRITRSTDKRAENMRNLIEFFKGKDLRPRQVAEFLKFGPSGARKYTRDLQEAGIIEGVGMVGDKNMAAVTPLYRLTDDESLREPFLLSMTANQNPKSPSNRKKKEVLGDPNCRLHLMSDDESYAVRTHKFVAHRDPLVEAFFGPARGAQ